MCVNGGWVRCADWVTQSSLLHLLLFTQFSVCSSYESQCSTLPGSGCREEKCSHIWFSQPFWSSLELRKWSQSSRFYRADVMCSWPACGANVLQPWQDHQAHTWNHAFSTETLHRQSANWFIDKTDCCPMSKYFTSRVTTCSLSPVRYSDLQLGFVTVRVSVFPSRPSYWHFNVTCLQDRF